MISPWRSAFLIIRQSCLRLSESVRIKNISQTDLEARINCLLFFILSFKSAVWFDKTIILDFGCIQWTQSIDQIQWYNVLNDHAKFYLRFANDDVDSVRNWALRYMNVGTLAKNYFRFVVYFSIRLYIYYYIYALAKRKRKENNDCSFIELNTTRLDSGGW